MGESYLPIYLHSIHPYAPINSAACSLLVFDNLSTRSICLITVVCIVVVRRLPCRLGCFSPPTFPFSLLFRASSHFYSMTFFLRKLRHRYTHVDNREESYEPAIIPTYNPGPAIIEYRLIACILILGAAVGALALLAGQYILQFECQSPRDIRAEKGNEFHSIKWTLLTFDYNQTFTHAPSVETNRAWDSLFPSKRHPTVTRRPSRFSR